MPFFTKYSIPCTNGLSSIEPSAHHPALFLIHEGIVIKNDWVLASPHSRDQRA